jgi:hypothetical protein
MTSGLDAARRATLASVAGLLIPAAYEMPSAADVVTDERLDFVLAARPDLAEPLRAALRPELGQDVAERLATLLEDEPAELGALQLVIVAAYYTDSRVRELIGYGGQQAIALDDWPDWTSDPGMIEQVKRRGPVWRDPSTGLRAAARQEE